MKGEENETGERKKKNRSSFSYFFSIRPFVEGLSNPCRLVIEKIAFSLSLSLQYFFVCALAFFSIPIVSRRFKTEKKVSSEEAIKIYCLLFFFRREIVFFVVISCWPLDCKRSIEEGYLEASLV